MLVKLRKCRYWPVWLVGSCGLSLSPGRADGPLAPSLFVRVIQSSDATANNAARKALDASITTWSQTQDLAGSYWMAALERPYSLTRIEVVNRAAPNDAELAGLTLRLLNLDDQVVFQSVLTNPGPAATFSADLPAGTHARSVWIGLEDNQKNGGGHFRVSLAEVRLFGDLAIPFMPPSTSGPGPTLNAKVTQSTAFSTAFPASNAMDGDPSTFTHTASQPNDYWLADLGAEFPIDRVELVNRQDCCSARLGGVVTRIYNGASNVLANAVETIKDPGLGGTWTWTPPTGTKGRYLRVGLENGKKNADGNYYITLAEARVWSGNRNLLVSAGGNGSVTNNLASNKPSYMVRLTPDIRPAGNANDDSYGTETRTTTATVDAYWEVDLGQTFALYGVRTIAASGIGGRLTNTIARCFDANHNSVYAKKLVGTTEVLDTDLGGPVFARYVRIGLENKQRTDPAGGIEWYIGMREVEVFGRPTNEVGILQFTASAPQISPGQPVSLSWGVEGIHRVELHPTAGSVGAPTDSSGAGRMNLSPTRSTEYLLIATNATEVFTRALAVTVGNDPLPVRLSEIVTDNKYSLADGYGNAPDWIELRNPGDLPVDLVGYGLSDDPARPMKWVFPAAIIAPHSELVVFASGSKTPVDPTGNFHASFKLNKTGGSVVLTAPNGRSTVDRLASYPPLDTDLAYGRDLDGNWTYLEPTPGAVNLATSYAGWVRPAAFSQARGFFQNAFSLTLSSADPDGAVYYSFDGSVPSVPYTTALLIATTKSMRVQVRRSGYRPARIQSQTYLFLDKVIASSVMNTGITKDSRYVSRVKPGLLALPSISLIVPGQPGYEEQEGSVEIFLPDGTPPVQANCGVERFGGSYENFAKKSFRVVCHAKYGTTRIKAPLFKGFDHGVAPVASFSELEFRSGSQDMVERGFYMAGPFVEDSLQDMGDLNPHNRFMHVYLNGVYWGLYHAREPLVQRFLANYLGGAAEDYVNVRGNDNVGDNFVLGTPTPPAIQSWEKALALKNKYQSLRNYVDVRSLIDFMLLWYYGDCESEFRASGPVNAGSGFKFWEADADGFLRTAALGLNRSDNPGPGGLFGGLVAEGDADFKTLLADRIYAVFFNDGALTPARNDARLAARMNEINDSLLAECARWGYRTPANWLASAATIRSKLFPTRTAQIISQLRSRGYFPAFDPPAFDLYGGTVTHGFHPQLTVPGGVIYYTLDASDPRLAGGAIAPTALSWTNGAVALTRDTVLSARVRQANGRWSALAQPHYMIAVNHPPIWLPQADVRFPAGLPLTLPMGVTDPDLPAQTLMLTATGLPPGLSLDAAAVRIVGVGTMPGEYSVDLTAADNQLPPQAGVLRFVIHLTEPFLLSARSLAAGVQLSFPANVGETYRLEFADDLTPPVWHTLQEFAPTNTNRVTWTEPRNDASSRRFFRVKWTR